MNEIQALGVTGKTLYGIVRNNSAQLWNGSTFETYTPSHYATYPVALAEQGVTGYYVGSFPTGIATAGLYNIDVRLQAGGSPAVSDSATGGFTVQWGGTAEATYAALASDYQQRGQAVTLPLAPPSGYGTDPTTGASVTAIKAKTDQLAFNPGGVVSGSSAPTALQVAQAVWQDLLTSTDFTQGGSAGAALVAIAGTLAQLGFDPTGNVKALVEGYANGQDPATILDAAPLSLAPTVGTHGEAMAAMRALAKGRKVESLGDNTMKIFAHDGVTQLFLVQYSPSIVAPNSTTTT